MEERELTAREARAVASLDRLEYALDAFADRHDEQMDGSVAGRLTLAALYVEVACRPPRGMRLSQQDILDALAMVSGIRALLDSDEGALLVLARKRGISHSRVAEALGLKSRQAAEQRLIKLERGSTIEENVRLDRLRRDRLKVNYSPSAVGKEAGRNSVARAVKKSRSVCKEG